MNIVYFALGVILLVIAIIDIAWTTLWVEGGAGPLTSRLMSWTWRVLRRTGGQNSRLLSLTGPLIFAISLSVWISLFWAGWTLIFASAENALIDTLNRGPISWLDRIYFTGYTMFTLGNGDFVPRKGVWQLATILATGNGMLFITLSVTYILSVLDAVTQKRSFATGVSGLGTQSTKIVQLGWNGHEFQGVELPINTYVSQLNSLTSNHKAYPILHYFHTIHPDQAPVSRIAALDEALTLLRFGIPAEHRPDDVLLTNARSSVHNYLEMLDQAFVEPADQTPPLPDISTLRDAGIPTVSDDEFVSSLNDLDERRRMLLGLIEADAREWPSQEETHELDESDGEVSVPTETSTRSQDDEEAELSRLVERINEALGTEFTDADQLFFDQVKEDALDNERLRQSAKVNSEDNFALEFDSMLTKLFIDRRDQNQELFQKFMDNDEVQDIITEHLRKKVYEASQETEA